MKEKQVNTKKKIKDFGSVRYHRIEKKGTPYSINT